MITNTKTKSNDLPDYFYLRITLDFETLRNKVIKCKFKDSRDYKRNRKNCWPSKPEKIYKDKGWKGYCDFLGKEEHFKQWPEFENLRKELNFKFKNSRDYLKNRERHWPSNPDKTYENKGWKGWDDFLGKEEKFKQWPYLSKLKKLVKGKFKNSRDYLKNRERHWPSNPDKTYENKGWKGWDDFLGNEWPRFETLKKQIKGKFKNHTEYRKYRKNRERHWPSKPEKIYKGKGWKGWKDFLGKSDWPSYSKLKKIVRENKIKSLKDYMSKRKENGWPSCPRGVYKGQWTTWHDFLGKD